MACLLRRAITRIEAPRRQQNEEQDILGFLETQPADGRNVEGKIREHVEAKAA